MLQCIPALVLHLLGMADRIDHFFLSLQSLLRFHDVLVSPRPWIGFFSLISCVKNQGARVGVSDQSEEVWEIRHTRFCHQWTTLLHNQRKMT